MFKKSKSVKVKESDNQTGCGCGCKCKCGRVCKCKCGCECGCTCTCTCDNDVAPAKHGCLPIKKWRIKCVCLQSQQCGCVGVCGCGCAGVCNTVDTESESADMALIDEEMTTKEGSQFKKAKALLIGINYEGTESQLNGCINDVHNMYTYLTQVEKFNPASIRLLTDDPNSDTEHLPTRKNIINGIRWLVNNNPMGDDAEPFSLFMHYSGHGSWVWDENRDESDSKDETICPLDYSENGLIIDDELRREIVTPIKDASNIKMTCVFDSCHSGTILDMRYNVRVKLNKARPDYSQITVAEDNHYEKSESRVTVFSGCMDKQYSSDAYIEHKSQGFMTWAFLYTVKQSRKEGKKISYQHVITQLQSLANTKGYDQIPQLTFNKYIDLKEDYTI